MIDLKETDPNSLVEAEAEKIKAILPKLAGLKRIISVVEKRAKELLAENPGVFDGEWELKEGAKDRRVVNQVAFVEALLSLPDARDEYPITAQDLLAIATFPVGKAESLLAEKFDLPQKVAAEKVNELGDSVISIGRKAPTLKECRK